MLLNFKIQRTEIKGLKGINWLCMLWDEDDFILASQPSEIGAITTLRPLLAASCHRWRAKPIKVSDGFSPAKLLEAIISSKRSPYIFQAVEGKTAVWMTLDIVGHRYEGSWIHDGIAIFLSLQCWRDLYVLPPFCHNKDDAVTNLNISCKIIQSVKVSLSLWRVLTSPSLTH